jgi:hypothetical protein
MELDTEHRPIVRDDDDDSNSQIVPSLCSVLLNHSFEISLAIIPAAEESIIKGFLQVLSSFLIMGHVYSAGDVSELFGIAQIHFKKRQQQG